MCHLTCSICLVSEIGGSENSRVTMRISERKKEILPLYSHPILELHRPNRVRLTITRANRILIFINSELKYDLDFPYTPIIKYVSFASSNFSNVEYYFNCEKKSDDSILSFFVNFSLIDGALLFALIISFSINIITLFIIFIAWSTN